MSSWNTQSPGRRRLLPTIPSANISSTPDKIAPQIENGPNAGLKIVDQMPNTNTHQLPTMIPIPLQTGGVIKLFDLKTTKASKRKPKEDTPEQPQISGNIANEIFTPNETNISNINDIQYSTVQSSSENITLTKSTEEENINTDYLLKEQIINCIINNIPKQINDLFSKIPKLNSFPAQNKVTHIPYKGYSIQNQRDTAYELKLNEETFVFIILRHVVKITDNKLWIAAYNHIRHFFTNKIIIIDDSSPGIIFDSELFNTEIIRSEYPGAGEILPYYYFLKHKWADKMICIHDSMFIQKCFNLEDINKDFRFHWYFVPSSNDDNDKISFYLSVLKNNYQLLRFFYSKEEWLGCFGAASICSLKKIQYLDEKYNIFSLLTNIIKTHSDRETFKRVLGIVLFYEGVVTASNCSSYGDIFKYPKRFEADTNLNIESFIHYLDHHHYDTAIVKVWRGR